MLDAINNAMMWYNNYIGGYVILLMLLPVGLFFLIRLRFLNITKFVHAIKIVAGKYDKKGEKGDVNHFKALTTALSSTVGTGNIVGVALAVYMGGPGAIFWMWVTGFLGMILKYSECTLAHKYRVFNSDGSVSGGPMYYIKNGITEIYNLPRFAKILAAVFAVATVLASLGTGNMAQANGMTGVLKEAYGINVYYSGIVITILSLIIVMGGLKRIAQVSERVVPFMGVMYVGFGFLVLFLNYQEIPHAFSLIFQGAFTPMGAVGGFTGSAIIMTMMQGVRRGLFSNEAGQGSAPIAHAAAKTEYAVREGLVSLLEPFVDTLIICTMTGLVLMTSGAWNSGIKGVGMTILAMSNGLAPLGISSWGKHIITAGLLLFAFTTIIGWSYYGSRAANYLFGEKAIKPYYLLYGLFVFFGCIWGIDVVWNFVDVVITFMTIPNLIALILLSGIVIKETKKYFEGLKNNTL